MIKCFSFYLVFLFILQCLQCSNNFKRPHFYVRIENRLLQLLLVVFTVLLHTHMHTHTLHLHHQLLLVKHLLCEELVQIRKTDM